MFALLAAAPASAARPATVVPCDTPSLISAVSNAVSAGGTQTVHLSVGCAYTLTAVNNGSGADMNGLPLITHTVRLTIDGSGATILRDAGAPRFRLFQVAAGASLTLDSLTLTGGHTPDGVSASNGNGGNGGAILNGGGTVTITNVTLRGNLTGNGGSCCSGIDIEKGGGGRGGGIFNDGGILSVDNSTIAGNIMGEGGSNGQGDGGAGGGLSSNDGTAIVTNSTFSGNSTGKGNVSGVLAVGGPGGGISVYSGTLSVTNSTIAGNSTGDNFNSLVEALGLGGGIAVYGGAMTVTNGTIANNTLGSNSQGGGYVAIQGTVVLLKNTLIVANTNENCVGAPAAGSTHNMADSSECGATFAQKTALQINLGPLQNNGGATLTTALRFPGAAIDAGDNASCPAVDQRGQPRPHGLGCDIGAYEFESALNFLFLPLVRR